MQDQVTIQDTGGAIQGAAHQLPFLAAFLMVMPGTPFTCILPAVEGSIEGGASSLNNHMRYSLAMTTRAGVLNLCFLTMEM